MLGGLALITREAGDVDDARVHLREAIEIFTALRTLGEDAYRRALAEGYAMSSEEAVSYTLEDSK